MAPALYEWISGKAQPLTATLTFEARLGNRVVSSDRVTFYRFQAVIVAIGGFTQTPATFEFETIRARGWGIYEIGRELYQTHGFDVHMFAEQEQSHQEQTLGTGQAYEEVRAAVNLRNVSYLAMLGFSWGAGLR
ncbi:MAG: hypothetical protein RMI91_09950 [Gemmatales bacterium]|nr:hypothetical protein [Gemmatales bacterium]MCS7166946.1 hypothetical protein [Gemmatales bacterium]MDW7994963.1 hypothetical protein [Gemmatales bacterium]MDW8224227.1 hypothetical protein [Gemmatales bacterium]